MDHVAIDLGTKESQICARNPAGKILLEKRLPTVQLARFFETLAPSRIILETSTPAFAIAGQAKSAGHEVCVVPASVVRTLGVAHRGIKTDLRDARALSEASTRVDLVSVHVPSNLAREMKACVALRQGLVRSRTMLVNGVRGWMRSHLLGPVSRNPETFTEGVRAHLARRKFELPPYVERQLRALDALNVQILEADLDVEDLAKGSKPCVRLMTVPGVGPNTAISFVAAVDQLGRFASAHALESYFGMTPGENSSSDSKQRTGLTKAGSSVVRWLVTQAAWSAWRTRPDDPMVQWAKSVAERRGKRVAVMALARKMVGIMFAMLRDGTPYDPKKGASAPPEPEPKPTTRRKVNASEVLNEARQQMAPEDVPREMRRAPRRKTKVSKE